MRDKKVKKLNLRKVKSVSTLLRADDISAVLNKIADDRPELVYLIAVGVLRDQSLTFYWNDVPNINAIGLLELAKQEFMRDDEYE